MSTIATLTGTDSLSVLAETMTAEVATVKSSHHAHVKALHAIPATDVQTFVSAFREAATDYRDAASYGAAAEAGRAFAASADALNAEHITYRVSLVAEYVRVFPKAGPTVLAENIAGTKANSAVKMFSRDLQNLRLVEASRAAIESAKATGATPPPALSVATAAKATRDMSGADVAAAIERVRKGEPVVDPSTVVVVAAKWSTVSGAASRMIDGLATLEANPSPEQRDALLGMLARIVKTVQSLPVKAEEPKA